MIKSLKDFLLFTSENKITIIIDERPNLDFGGAAFEIKGNILALKNVEMLNEHQQMVEGVINIDGIPENDIDQISSSGEFNLGTISKESKLTSAFTIYRD